MNNLYLFVYDEYEGLVFHSSWEDTEENLLKAKEIGERNSYFHIVRGSIIDKKEPSEEFFTDKEESCYMYEDSPIYYGIEDE